MEDQIGLPRLQEGVDPTYAAGVLLEAATTAGNVMGAAGAVVDLFAAYQEWAAKQEFILSSVLSAEELSRLLLTQRYWALTTGLITYGLPLSMQLHTELKARTSGFEQAAAAITSEVAAWAYSSQYTFAVKRRHAIVLDTCVLEMHPEVVTYPWVDKAGIREGAIALVIPSVVRDELDAHKLSNNKLTVNGKQVELRKQARTALKALDQLFPTGESWVHPHIDTPHPVSVFLPVDELTRHRVPSADNEIVIDALELKPYAETVTLASYDSNIGFTAQRYGLGSIRLRYDD